MKSSWATDRPAAARRTVSIVALGFLAALATGCYGTRTLSDPTVVVRGFPPDPSQPSELGVATDYGVVFLGRSGRSGEVEITAWFGDGPSVEYGVVEPVGGELYTAEMEIRLPAVPLSFETPSAGTQLVVTGRRGADTWDETVRVVQDPRVTGLLLAWDDRVAADSAQVGAGVYSVDDEGARKLVGLVTGTLELSGSDGARRRYLTALGPEEMWRLVTYDRSHSVRPRWVYREDIL